MALVCTAQLPLSLVSSVRTVVCVHRYLDIVFSFVWQVLLLSEPLNTWSIIGAVLVTSCAFVNPVKQWHASRQPDKHMAVATVNPDEAVETAQLVTARGQVERREVELRRSGNEGGSRHTDVAKHRLLKEVDEEDIDFGVEGDDELEPDDGNSHITDGDSDVDDDVVVDFGEGDGPLQPPSHSASHVK